MQDAVDELGAVVVIGAVLIAAGLVPGLSASPTKGCKSFFESLRSPYSPFEGRAKRATKNSRPPGLRAIILLGLLSYNLKLSFNVA